MKRQYLVGGIVIALCAATAAFTLRGAAMPHYTFEQAQTSGRSCQIYGKLLRESVKMSAGMRDVAFTVEEKATGRRLPVRYDNPSEPVAANFAAATDVRAIGTYDPKEGTFVATQLYTKCPSKYDSGGYKKEQPAGVMETASR
jgi:cytochrome c-type biogenesis protein CcmE